MIREVEDCLFKQKPTREKFKWKIFIQQSDANISEKTNENIGKVKFKPSQIFRIFAFFSVS